jgi:hypothetical protein
MPALGTKGEALPMPEGPAGPCTIPTAGTNTRAPHRLLFSFFTVTELSGNNVLLNADERTMGVGATVLLGEEGEVLAPDQTVAVDFVIGLQERVPFQFFVELFAKPLP